MNGVARKAISPQPARSGGDLGSPRNAAGLEAYGRGLPMKARLPPKPYMQFMCGIVKVWERYSGLIRCGIGGNRGARLAIVAVATAC